MLVTSAVFETVTRSLAMAINSHVGQPHMAYLLALLIILILKKFRKYSPTILFVRNCSQASSHLVDKQNLLLLDWLASGFFF